MEVEFRQGKESVNFKLDTGAQVNMIPLELFHHFKWNNREKTTKRLFGYGGSL